VAAFVIGPRRRYRSRYRRQDSRAGVVVVVAVGALLASGGAKAAASHGHAHRAAPAVVPVSGSGEAAFFTAALADLGAPATAANLSSLAAWGAREGCWGCVGQYNQLDSTLYEPGAWAFNTFDGNLHVWSYPTASEGAQATAATIGGYPGITAALRSGGGLCGGMLAAEFSRWSGGGYQEVC
jgi:hypothetical protein